jgi:polyphosphate kinase
MAKNQKKPPKISNEVYEAEMVRLQTELVKLQEWTRQNGARILVIFEGRDAAGKGGAIKRITEYLSPRVAPIVALPTPTERERGQWYYQRYIAHLPTKGEIVLVRGGVRHQEACATEHDRAPAVEHSVHRGTCT